MYLSYGRTEPETSYGRNVDVWNDGCTTWADLVLDEWDAAESGSPRPRLDAYVAAPFILFYLLGTCISLLVSFCLVSFGSFKLVVVSCMRTINCLGLCGEWHIKPGANYAHEYLATCFYQYCWKFIIIVLNNILWIVSYQQRGIRMMELKWVSRATTFFGMWAFGTFPFGLAPKCDLNLGFSVVTPMWYQHVAVLETFFVFVLEIGCFHAKLMTRVWYTLVTHEIFDSMHFNGMKKVCFLMLFFQRYLYFLHISATCFMNK
jgi:hypothetical protein